MKVSELKKIMLKAKDSSLVLLKVADRRKVVHVNAWVDDNGILVLEEDE